MTDAAAQSEATLTLEVLRQCPACHSPHPRTLGLVQDHCQVCGGPAAPITTTTVDDVRMIPHG